YFKEAITWSLITSGGFSIRYRSSGSIHDVSGVSGFSNDTSILLYILGLTSTKISDYVFKMINPTINLPPGDFKKMPVIIDNTYKEVIINTVKSSINISKIDWDSFEISWDFKKFPLLTSATGSF